jgi:hypothetical protein
LQGHFTSIPVLIDGDLQEPFWREKTWWSWYMMGDLVTGQVPDKNRTTVSFRMTPDKSALVIGVICDEGRMDKVIAKAKDHDDFDIFNEDRVEVYIETPERSYFKIVVNSEGKIWDESQDVTIVTRDTLPTLWNPGTKAAVKKEKDRWTVELMIPTKDFGSLGPAKAYPWGVNVCRVRRAGNEREEFALAPAGVPQFLEKSQWANLWIR